MSAPHEVSTPAIARREVENVVRDFVAVLNEGCLRDLVPFLDENLTYRASTHRTVRGLPQVLAMIAEINASFIVRHVTLDALAVDGSTALAQQSITLALPGRPSQAVLGFASYRFRGLRMVEWTQTYA
jgi:limonene-1,2-epoxide hydrolase